MKETLCLREVLDEKQITGVIGCLKSDNWFGNRSNLSFSTITSDMSG